MTDRDYKLIKDAIKPFIATGLIDCGVEEEIKTLTTTSATKGSSSKQPELVTQTEAMSILKISRQTLYNWKRKGLIKPIKLAGVKLVRYQIDDLKELLTH